MIKCSILAVRSCPKLSNLFLAYPSIGIWDNPEGPDNLNPWDIGSYGVDAEDEEGRVMFA